MTIAFKIYEHGNCTEMPHLPELVWDYKDELKEVTLDASNNKAYYVYDAGGERVRKIVEKTGGIIEQRFYLGGFEIYRKAISGTLDYERETLQITEGRNTISQLETKTVENGNAISSPTTNQRFQYSNHLGSACLELDENAAIISFEEYHPFGTTSYRSGVSETEVSQKRYKYVGKERDEETGLYYYGARFYSAWLCRFVRVDPLATMFPFYSPYQYAGNKPINSIDLDGLESKNFQEEEKGQQKVSKIESKGLEMAKEPKYQKNRAYIPLKDVKSNFAFGLIKVDIAPGETIDNITRKEVYDSKNVTWCNQFTYDLTKEMEHGNPWYGKEFTDHDGNKQKAIGVNYRVNANFMNQIMNDNPDVFHEVSLNESWDFVNAGGMVYYSWDSGSSASGHIATGVPSDELSTLKLENENIQYGNVVQAGAKVGKFSLLGKGGVYKDKLAKEVQAFVLIKSLPGLAERIEDSANPLEKITPKKIEKLQSKPMNEPELKLR
ncbi:MAG: RHS repeat-associated core domain-containing protein [Bacteroidetes bacterium]|nr:RHS repeat-associated core domain-containing protein [Bacteroidota bacterium]